MATDGMRAGLRVAEPEGICLGAPAVRFTDKNVDHGDVAAVWW